MGNNVKNSYGYSWSSDGEEVMKGRLDLENKNYVISGATRGIGLETMKVLLKYKARVVIIARDMEKVKEMIKEFRDHNVVVNYIIIDLKEFEGIEKIISEKYKFGEIDGIINNAGCFGNYKKEIINGVLMQYAVNHFSHFALTLSLLKYLKKDGRIVNISSNAHIYFSPKLDLDDLQMNKMKYNVLKAYSLSKLMNVLFSFELHKRLKKDHGISIFAVHPGTIKTDFHKDQKYLSMIFYPLLRLFNHVKSIQQGAATTIFCTVDDRIVDKSGSYFSDCDIFEASEQARDEDLAKRLFEISERITGIKLKNAFLKE